MWVHVTRHPMILCVLYAPPTVLVGGACVGGGEEGLVNRSPSVTGHMKLVYHIDHQLS
jgi:hypothetical protein